MKLNLVDTHSHIYLSDFSHDRDDILKRAQEMGVGGIILPNIDIGSVKSVISVSEQYPNILFPLIGLHPCSVCDTWETELNELQEYLDVYKWYGIGEVGLDLYWDKTSFDKQVSALKTQIQWAKSYDLPIVLHTREAIDETLSILESHKESNLRGVLHCFTGDEIQARKAIELGFFLGIGGVVTFKNSGLGKVLSSLGPDVLDYILLETDSPYLAPVPNRGKRNEPSYLVHILMALSEILYMTPSELAATTTRNAEKLFRLPSN